MRTGPVRTNEVREQDGVAFDVSVPVVTGDGAVTVAVAVAGDGDGTVRVAVNREFLLRALAAEDRDRLVLEVGGPTPPWRCGGPTTRRPSRC